MPLPFLVIPLAVAAGSALAQAIAKLRSHARLNTLRAELEDLESRHRDEMRQQYERQIELCSRLDSPEPELPAVLQETVQVEVEDQPEPRWRRLLKRRKRTVADGSASSLPGRNHRSPRGELRCRCSLESMVGNDPESAASYQRQAADFRAQACRARRYRRFNSCFYGPAVRLGRLQHIWHRPGAGICRLGNHPRNQEREKGTPGAGDHPDGASGRAVPIHGPHPSVGKATRCHDTPGGCSCPVTPPHSQ